MDFVLLVGGAVLFCLWLWFWYNQFVTRREICNATKSNIDTEIARRYDLYLKASGVLQSGSEFERGVFTQVAKIRTRDDIDILQKVREIDRLIATAESNPNVSSVGLFRSFQDAVTETETKIQNSRVEHNENVAIYNVIISKFPANIAAAILRFHKRPYFEFTG